MPLRLKMGKYFRKHEDEEEKEEYKFPDYMKTELWELNNLLKEKYNDGNKVDDITKWLQDEGALGKFGGVIYNSQPSKYEILQDKLSKANALLGRKEFAVKKELEELEKGMKPEPVDF